MHTQSGLKSGGIQTSQTLHLRRDETMQTTWTLETCVTSLHFGDTFQPDKAGAIDGNFQ